MKKVFFFVLTLSFFLVGCVQKVLFLDTVMEIKLDLPATENKLKLSVIVDSIKYVPLETTDLSVFGSMDKLIVTDRGEYLIADKEITSALYLFDADGRFLRKIGNKGGGPDEYIGLEDVAYYNRNIFIWDSKGRKILKYTMEGDVVATYGCKYVAYSFSCVDEDNFVFYCVFARNDDFDIDGKLPNLIRYNVKEKSFGYDLYFDGSIPSHAYLLSLNNLSNNNLYSTINDTIYKVYPDSISPQFVLRYKDDYIDERNRYLKSFISQSHSMELDKKFPELITYFDCNKCHVFFIRKGKYLHYAFWYPKLGFCKEASSKSNPIVNDLDGIADFFLRYSSGEILYSVIEPGLLKEKSSDMASLLNVREDDNLVIVKMFVK